MTMLGSIKNIRDKAFLLKREGSKTRKLVRACWQLLSERGEAVCGVWAYRPKHRPRGSSTGAK